jgi:alkylhydroperoxidase family enzyme
VDTETLFELDTANLQVRDDIPEAFRQTWQHIAAPSSGWDGAQRVAIARECRQAWDCELCIERKSALSHSMVQGQHHDTDLLPSAAVDAVHRITTDPARVTEDWFKQLLSAGLTDSQYVEIIGIVGTVTSVDTFCSALGLPLESLPEPQPGEPTGYRPDRLKHGGTWLPMLMETDLPKPEKDLYHGSKVGANVLRCLSLVPSEVRNLQRISKAMYLRDRDVKNFKATGGRAISRNQIELIAARVSLVNECFY